MSGELLVELVDLASDLSRIACASLVLVVLLVPSVGARLLARLVASIAVEARRADREPPQK